MKITTALLLLVFLVLPSWAKLSPHQIFEENRSAICLVTYYQNISSDAKIGSFNKIERNRIGVLVGPDGLVMVSSDVYPVSLDIISDVGSLLSGKPTDFKVKLNDGREFPAEFLGKDDQAKVAFIRMKNLPEGGALPFVSFGASAHLGVADSIYVLELLSKTYNFAPLFTAHMVNSVIESPRRKFLLNNCTTALSAGGLVLDAQGHAVGVTLKQEMDFSFRPPEEFEDFQKDYLEIAPAEWFLDLIKNPPKNEAEELSQKSWLGVRMQGLPEELQEYWKVPQKGGIVINEVYPESPAEKAGLKSGDIILGVNDSLLLVRKDEDTDKLQSLIRSFSPGETVSMKIFRVGKILKKKVRLMAAPKAIGLADSYPVPQLGFELRELTRDVLYQEDLPLSTPGAFVYQVDRASPAGLAGLRIGAIIQKVDGEPVKDLEHARKIIGEIIQNSQKRIMLQALDGRVTGFVFIDLNQ